MALQGILLERVEDLLSLREEWDALAVANGRPYCSPAWMLGWWHHVAEAGARLRAVAVTDEGALVGLAPFWVARRRSLLSRYRLLGAGVAAPVEPLARPGHEREVAAVISSYLASATPRAALVALDGVPADSPWPHLLRDSWPARRPPRIVQESSRPLPTVDLEGGYEEWFAARRPHFRQQVRRYRRRIEERGGRFHMAEGVAELEPRLRAFARLHESRWVERGGTAALDARVERMLLQVARDAPDEQRFRLWCIDSDETAVSAHLMVAAGGAVSYWLGGFDEEWRAHSPAMLTVLAAIEDAFERGDRRLDLGPGGQEYKYRLADREERLDWLVLVPPGPRHALARARYAALGLVRAVSRRLPPGPRDRAKRLLRRP